MEAIYAVLDKFEGAEEDDFGFPQRLISRGHGAWKRAYQESQEVHPLVPLIALQEFDAATFMQRRQVARHVSGMSMAMLFGSKRWFTITLSDDPIGFSMDTERSWFALQFTGFVVFSEGAQHRSEDHHRSG